MVFAIVFLGLIIGSFLNVVIYRSALGRPISEGRSKCPKCGKVLRWFELVPVLSFVIQKRRCRGCGEKISWQYPLVELLTAAVFVLIWQVYLKNQSLFFQNKIIFFVFSALILYLAADLIAIFVYDLIHLEVPMSFLIWGLVFAFFSVLFRDINTAMSAGLLHKEVWKAFLQSALLSGILGALAAGGFFLFLVLISKEKWMGQGDIYIGAIVGLLIGWPWILEALIIAFVSGAIIGIILMLFANKQLSAKIAFGPFLVFSCFAVLLWGQVIFERYLKVILNFKF